jgi:hypothetical protein
MAFRTLLFSLLLLQGSAAFGGDKAHVEFPRVQLAPAGTVKLVQPKVPPLDFTDAPAESRRVARMLAVWHESDLPHVDAWASVPEAGAALIWLGSHGRVVGDRQRALWALQFFPSEASKAALMQHIADTELHFLIRLGAADGLLGQKLLAAECDALEALEGLNLEVLQEGVGRVTNGTPCK